MPFSSLTDPADLARSQAALEEAWKDVGPSVKSKAQQHERERLAYIVAALAVVVADEHEIARQAADMFRLTA